MFPQGSKIPARHWFVTRTFAVCGSVTCNCLPKERSRDEMEVWGEAKDSPFRQIHDDVIKWKHFPCYWPFERGIPLTKASDAELR